MIRDSDYRKDIDGLRAVAILLVVVFHFDVFSIGKSGFIGVDIFFVISGFLITGIILRDLRVGKFSIAKFVYRRIRRLYPAMLAVLGLYIAVGFWLLLPHEFEELTRETLLSLIYVINFYFWQNVNYFGLQAAKLPLLHMWSLAVEEQFYLLFPLFCFLVYRFRASLILPALVLLTAVSFCLGVYSADWKPEAAFYLLPTRIWELTLGGVLAAALINQRPSGIWLTFLGPLGLGMIMVSLWLYSPVTKVPGWFLLLPTAGAAAIILGGYSANAGLTKLLSIAPLVWLGQISYPLYLVHWPVVTLLKGAFLDFSLHLRLAGIALSIILAWTIYRFVETPIRAKLILPQPRLFVGVTATLSALLIGISVTGIWTNGFPGRFTPDVNRILSYARDTPELYQSCEFSGRDFASFCLLGNPDQAPTILVIGDSHARALAGSVDLWLKRTKKSALFSFEHGCAPVEEVGSAKCSKFVSNSLNEAKINPTIREVVLISIWLYDNASGIFVDGQWVRQPEAAKRFSDAIVSTVKNLVSNGHRVTLIEPFYSAPNDVPRTLASNTVFGRDWPINRPLSEHVSNFESLFGAFDKAETAGARRVSLIDDFCKGGNCRGVWEGRPVFTDNNHLAFGMSEVVSRILEREAAK